MPPSRRLVSLCYSMSEWTMCGEFGLATFSVVALAAAQVWWCKERSYRRLRDVESVPHGSLRRSITRREKYGELGESQESAPKFEPRLSSEPDFLVRDTNAILVRTTLTRSAALAAFADARKASVVGVITTALPRRGPLIARS
jgi:hypothetical protein